MADVSNRRRGFGTLPANKYPIVSKYFNREAVPRAVEIYGDNPEKMALRRLFGLSDGELMRSDCKPCTRLMRHTAGVFTFGGAMSFWVLCRLHYGPRITVPRSLRWAATGAISASLTTALLVRLLSPECEPQNIAAYDKKK